MRFPPIFNGWREVRRWWRMRDCPHPWSRVWCMHDDGEEVRTWCCDCDQYVDEELMYCTHTGELHSEMDT